MYKSTVVELSWDEDSRVQCNKAEITQEEENIYWETERVGIRHYNMNQALLPLLRDKKNVCAI
jgi:hypothetical protein